jgi:HxlR-like helix-turn-helix
LAVQNRCPRTFDWHCTSRYQELDEAPDGVSHKVLTDTLRRAERDGLVGRHLDPGRVDTATLYQLTRSCGAAVSRQRHTRSESGTNPDSINACSRRAALRDPSCNSRSTWTTSTSVVPT